MKKSLMWGLHGHGFLCKKGKKGKFMCCLAFKQGIHDGKTCVFIIILFKSEDIEKKPCADVQAFPTDNNTVAMLNTPNDALTGTLKEQHPIGPIVWEQTQCEQDAYYCENNLIVTNIIDCANNSNYKYIIQ
jgi:hypothetical protein